MRDITDRKRSEEERADLLAREQQARAAAETAREREAFLAEASAVLASSLDHRTTLASVARLVVPRIADGCAVDMIDSEGQLRRLVTSHSDPSRVAAAEDVASRYPPRLGALHGTGRVAATGESELMPEVTDAILRETARNEEHLGMLRALKIASLMCVPLPGRGRILGAITLASSESGRRFGPEDLAFAEDLAARASVAIENARLYREAREAVRARDEFLSIASHELKTPLTTLQLQIQGLVRKIGSATRDPMLELLGPRLSTAERQVERLTGLINNLLDISRITAGRLDLDLETVDLTNVVRDAAARSREDLARAGCALDLQTDGPCIGRWDRPDTRSRCRCPATRKPRGSRSATTESASPRRTRPASSSASKGPYPTATMAASAWDSGSCGRSWTRSAERFRSIAARAGGPPSMSFFRRRRAFEGRRTPAPGRTFTPSPRNPPDDGNLEDEAIPRAALSPRRRFANR
jgi:GAF domain-containing protein